MIELYRNNILYLNALTLEKSGAKIKYTIDENELPQPPKVHNTKS